MGEITKNEKPIPRFARNDKLVSGRRRGSIKKDSIVRPFYFLAGGCRTKS
jgi:hypothetical protein